MIAAVLIAVVSTHLRCIHPDEFFDAQGGTQAVMSREVPAVFVYDDAVVSNKCLRVMAETAAFYYSLISGYMERELLFGESKGVLADTNGMSKAEAFSRMRSNTLVLDLGNAAWLNSWVNRIVRGFARFSEGTLTQDLVADWMDAKRGRWSHTSPYGTIVPRYFTNAWSAASIDFPEIVFKEPNEILGIVTRDVLERSWVTWAQLYDWPYAHTAESQPTYWLRELMGWGCDDDQRSGSPATRFGVSGVDSRSISESLTNVIETLAPGCMANFTNATRRLDYRRLVALSRALSVDDRRIDAEPFGRIGIETAWGCTNFLTAKLDQLCVCAITNASAGSAAYDSDVGGVQAAFTVSAGDIRILTNTFTVATNYAGPGAVAVARRSELKESIENSVGGATYEVQVSLDDFKGYAPSGSRCHFAAYGNMYQTPVRADLSMWHGSSADPGSYDHTERVRYEDFQCTKVMVNIWRWQGCEHSWSLDPRDLPDEARVPSPATHDHTAVLPGGVVWPYYGRNYPKWMHENGSLVGSVDVFSCGNVIAKWDANIDAPAYSSIDSEAWYYHLRNFRLSYTNALAAVWADVAAARQFAVRKFAAKTGAPPGALESVVDPDASMAESMSGVWGGFYGGPMSTSPQELNYRSGNFYDDGDNVVTSIRVSFALMPGSRGTNTVGRALSVGGNCGYLGGLNATFKNLVPVQD